MTLVCDDCNDQEAVETVQCPIDEERRLDLCEECYEARGPGIDIYHVTVNDDWDINGGRASGELADSEKRHMNNTVFPAPGWLGNPFEIGQDGDRHEVLRKYRRDLLEKCREEPIFVHHLSKVRDKRIACWCRSAAEERTPETRCHLDVVHATLMGLYRDTDLSRGGQP